MTDATFEDGAFSGKPLNLGAETVDDLTVVSALVQDAVGTTREISWMPKRHRFLMLFNRFRWENQGGEETPERVRSALVFENALSVQSRGLDPGDPDTVFSPLSIAFEPGDDGAGTVLITLAGDGELALSVEALDARLIDLTQPWQASGAPKHDVD